MLNANCDQTPFSLYVLCIPPPIYLLHLIKITIFCISTQFDMEIYLKFFNHIIILSPFFNVFSLVEISAHNMLSLACLKERKILKSIYNYILYEKTWEQISCHKLAICLDETRAQCFRTISLVPRLYFQQK